MKSEIKNTYQICNKLVLDTTYPGIKFDKNGISSQYWDYQNNVKDKWIRDQKDPIHLEKIVEKVKKEWIW